MLHHAIILTSYNNFAKLCDHVSSGLPPGKLQMTKNTDYNENSDMYSTGNRQNYASNVLLSVVKAGSVFFGRICTSGTRLYTRLCVYLII